MLAGLNSFWIIKRVTNNSQVDQVLRANKVRETTLIDQSDQLKELYYGKYSDLSLVKGSEIEKLLDSEQLVLNFGEGNCYGCLIEPLNYIENLAKLIGPKRIVINGFFKKIEVFESFRSQISALVGDYHFTNTQCLPEELKNEFAIFVVDRTFRITYLFLPELQTTMLKDYFQIYLPTHFNQ
jgi:hypothetical protein